MSFDTWDKPNWCPGCGNFGILNALKLALKELNLPRENLVMTGGIGCSSKIPQWVNVNAFCGLHGRTVSVATGIKLARPDLKVIATGGDGDGYGEGGNHFLSFCKNNPNVTYFVHDNQIYGLTKGQASPTTEEGYVTKTTPWGAFNQLNPIALAVSAGATFIARGYAGDLNELKDLMKRAINHKGSAILDILQPCVTFNKLNTYQWYKERCYYLKNSFKSREEAFSKSLEWGAKIPLGVFYEVTEETLDEHLPKPLPVVKRNVSKLMRELM